MITVFNVFKRKGIIRINDEQRRSIAFEYQRSELTVDKIMELLLEFQQSGGTIAVAFPYWLQEKGYIIDIK